MPDYNLGDVIRQGYTPTVRRPRWLNFTGYNFIMGTVQLPSGHHRLVYRANGLPWAEMDIHVLPPALEATSASWRCRVYKSNGKYITMDNLGNVPTIGTPKVRMSPDGPAKAEVVIPIMPGASSVTSSSFAGWSDNSTGAIERGMEMTVEYRDASTGTMVLVFRGIIYQVSKGEAITLTAYDRLMDLAQFSEQYQSNRGYIENEHSVNTADAGDDYVYSMSASIGVIASCQAAGRASINALGQMGTGAGSLSDDFTGYKIHNLPTAQDGGGISRTPAQGERITKVSTRVFVQQTIDSSGTVHAVLALYHKSGNTFTPVYTTTEKTMTGINTWADLEWDVDWPIEDSPGTYYIGGHWWYDGTPYTRGKGYARSTTRYTTTTYYSSSDGTSWVSESSGNNLPEVAIQYEHMSTVQPEAITPSGNTATIAKSDIPAYPPADGTYVTMVSKGDYILLSYVTAGSTTLRSIVSDLIKWAGLYPDIPAGDIGSTTYYTSSTYEYLSCIQELIRGAGYGLRTPPTDPGLVQIRPRHTVDEASVLTVTTAPGGAGEAIILQHDLTAHWMAEKATVAYLAEDATISGLPVALETDDRLKTDSLITDLGGSLLRQVIADKSLADHGLQANAAGGRILKLHTNVVEGTLVLAGYRTDLWDVAGAGIGGLPVTVDVPESGINAVAVPTQVIYHDGITEVALDNVRTAERSELANSMSMTADAISNGSGELPDTVYVFAVDSNYGSQTGYQYLSTPDYAELYDVNNNKLAIQNNVQFIKAARDSAGYGHLLAIFPANQSGYATNAPIGSVFIRDTAKLTGMSAILDNPKYALAGQNVHVDLRYKLTP